jgi:PAS domain-containing protein
VLDDERVIFANVAFLDLLGYEDLWQLVGRHADVLLHPVARAAATARRQFIRTAKRPLTGVPTKLLSRSGRAVSARATISMIDAGEARYTLVQVDVANEAEWRALPSPEIGPVAEHLGVAVLDNLSLPVAIEDAETIIFLNRTALGILGAVSPDDLEGSHNLSVSHADAVESRKERLDFFFSTRQVLRDVPVKLQGVGGHTVYARGDVYPIEAEGRPAALIIGTAGPELV